MSTSNRPLTKRIAQSLTETKKRPEPTGSGGVPLRDPKFGGATENLSGDQPGMMHELKKTTQFEPYKPMKEIPQRPDYNPEPAETRDKIFKIDTSGPAQPHTERDTDDQTSHSTPVSMGRKKKYPDGSNGSY